MTAHIYPSTPQLNTPRNSRLNSIAETVVMIPSTANSLTPFGSYRHRTYMPLISLTEPVMT